MKAVLDHVGIAVKDLTAALAFYRDALGLEIEAPEEVASQHVRAHFVPVGEAKLELLEATSAESAIAKYVDKRGPGLHHITLRVEDVRGAIAHLKARGARLIDESPREGAEGSLIAFVHPAATHGVLVELKQAGLVLRQAQDERVDGAHHERPEKDSLTLSSSKGERSDAVTRYTVGDLELISVCDGFVRFDGGAMFGVVPKALWEKQAPADARNRIMLAMRPLVIRGARTMIVDAGLGDKEDARFCDIYGVDRVRNLDHTLAEAGLAPEDIDIVLASHLHFDHAGGFTMRGPDGRLRPRFPRAQYVVRRGEWEDATHPHARNRASYLLDNYLPLADAGVLQLVDDDQTIMPGVKVRRTGGHTMHHQMIAIESGGKTAAFVADLIPTAAHAPDPWLMGFDLYPMDTLAAKSRFAREAVEKGTLVFLEHDPAIAAGYIREIDGRRSIQPLS
jgi:methylmalonyl-CoA epimerase